MEGLRPVGLLPRSGSRFVLHQRRVDLALRRLQERHADHRRRPLEPRQPGIGYVLAPSVGQQQRQQYAAVDVVDTQWRHPSYEDSGVRLLAERPHPQEDAVEYVPNLLLGS